MRNNKKFHYFSNCLKTPLALLFATAFLTSFSSPLNSTAATLKIPQDYSSIQEAINNAVDGDIVEVGPGSYMETITFAGSNISIVSSAGPENTIIDGNGLGTVVAFASSGSENSELNGFTIRNGKGDLDGGGIVIDGGTPSVVDCIITSNTACTGGAGIAVRSGSPIIQGNSITANARQTECSGGNGGGIRISGQGSAQIIGNVISENSFSDGGGISLNGAGTPLIKDNRIIGNTAPFGQGGGIWIVNVSNADIIQNLFVANQALQGGGIWWQVQSSQRGPFLLNNTLADNLGNSGSEIYADGFDAQVETVNNIVFSSGAQTAIYCGSLNAEQLPVFKSNLVFSSGGNNFGGACVEQSGQQGNISEEPLFSDRPKGDYSLTVGSPGIDAGDETYSQLPDADISQNARIADGDDNGEAIVDMGAFEFVGNAGALELENTEYHAYEGDGEIQISVIRTGGSSGEVSVDYSLADGSAAAGEDYTSTAGTLIFAHGETAAQTFSIPILEDNRVEGFETVNIVLSNPVGAALGGNASATLTIGDPAVGLLQFTAISFSVNENQQAATVEVERVGGSTGEVSVKYSTADDGALAGEDYSATQGLMVFSDGEDGTKTFQVPILDDSLVEGEEKISLQLSEPSGGAELGAISTAELLITDVERGVLQIEKAEYQVRENGGTLVVSITRTNGSDGAVEVDYSTKDGTATADDDYTALSGKISFEDGDAQAKQVEIQIVDDSVAEKDETFELALSNPTNGASLGEQNSATITIGDFEAGTIQFEKAYYEVAEVGGSVLITITRTGGSDGAASVEFKTSNNTAFANLDYEPLSQTVSFSDGDAKPKTIQVSIFPDAVYEGDETINLVLGQPSPGVGLGSPSFAMITIKETQPGLVQLSSSSFEAAEDAGAVTITVNRIAGTQGEVSVQYSTEAGTAEAGVDYEETSGTLVFADGDTAKTFTVPLLNDSLLENNETFQLALSNPTGAASLGTRQATITIVDNDGGSRPSLDKGRTGCFITSVLGQ